jgi:hypothetical protein
VSLTTALSVSERTLLTIVVSLMRIVSSIVLLADVGCDDADVAGAATVRLDEDEEEIAGVVVAVAVGIGAGFAALSLALAIAKSNEFAGIFEIKSKLINQQQYEGFEYD